MEGDRIEAAVQRIEQALARIAAIAERPAAPDGASPAPAAPPPNVMQLVSRHEALRETVLDEIGRIDALIRKLEG
ncbi:hypothetical protein WAB17_13010 [Parerythrobacter aurantius]|uniref:hypothetical protein n=1 Tax=Parerythrobacter aurantius TaxID=3127706 RepID=UPI00324DF368